MQKELLKKKIKPNFSRGLKAGVLASALLSAGAGLTAEGQTGFKTRTFVNDHEIFYDFVDNEYLLSHVRFENVKEFLYDQVTAIEESILQSNLDLNAVAPLSNNLTNIYQETIVANHLDKIIANNNQNLGACIARMLTHLDAQESQEFMTCYDYLAATTYQKSLGARRDDQTLPTLSIEMDQVRWELLQSGIDNDQETVAKHLEGLLKNITTKDQSLNYDVAKMVIQLSLYNESLWALRDVGAVGGTINDGDKTGKITDVGYRSRYAMHQAVKNALHDLQVQKNTKTRVK